VPNYSITAHAFVKATLRLGLRAPLVARRYIEIIHLFPLKIFTQIDQLLSLSVRVILKGSEYLKESFSYPIQ